MKQITKTAYAYPDYRTPSDEKITCRKVGEYGFEGYENAIGDVWEDEQGNRWFLWRFSRKYSFVPYRDHAGENRYWFRAI